MAHRCEHLCSASQLWLPHPALCIVLPECFWGLCIWSRAMGSKSGKLWNVADHDTHFGQRPCQWQSEIALQLIYGKNLVLISATGSRKSFIFWLPMVYKNGLTLMIIPLKTLGQQLANESCQQGFCAVSVTAELVGESPTLIEVQ